MPKGITKILVEDKEKNIRYEYVDVQGLVKLDFEEERQTDAQRKLQKLILLKGFPNKEKTGNFWAGVPKLADREKLNCHQLVKWAQNFDIENRSCLGNIQQYALYLASRVKIEGWESVAEKTDRIYEDHRIIKDNTSNKGFSYVGGGSDNFDDYSVSDIIQNIWP